MDDETLKLVEGLEGRAAYAYMPAAIREACAEAAARIRRLAERVEALEGGLRDCVTRLRRCAENGGNAPFAVDALCGQFDALLAPPADDEGRG